MTKTKREQRAMRPLYKRYGFYVHLIVFVIFAIISPVDWYMRIIGLILHFIAPYIWHELFKGRRDEIYNAEQYQSKDLWGDAHLGIYLAIITMLWANVTVSLINLDIVWNPSLVQLTIFWGMAVGLHRYVLHLMKQRDSARERVKELEAELNAQMHSAKRLEIQEKDEIELAYEDDDLEKEQYS